MDPEVKRVVEDNAPEILWSVAKYIFIGFTSLASLFGMWVLGKYRKQHEDMYDIFMKKSGPDTLKLKAKEEEEYKSYKKLVEEVHHDVNALKTEIRISLQVVLNRIANDPAYSEIQKEIQELRSKLKQ